MKKFLLCLTSLIFTAYGAEDNIKTSVVEDIIKKDIKKLKSKVSTTFSDKFHLENQNNDLTNKNNAIISEYQKIEAKYEKKSIDEKTLLLHRYKCIDALLENLLYTQALLDIINQESNEKLHAEIENLFQRKIKFADNYNVYHKGKGLDKQKILLGLQHSTNLFNDIKEHSKKIQDLILSHLKKRSA